VRGIADEYAARRLSIRPVADHDSPTAAAPGTVAPKLSIVPPATG
jgi:hypothetical protein